MKRLIAAVAASAALVGVGAASAHPLGNFTVNRHSGIELSGDSIYVRYALDLAEIPTFQEGEEVRAPGFAQRVAEGLELRVDGRRVALAPLEYKVQERPGAGGLATLRFDGVFAAPRDGSGRTLVFRDTNFSSRIGWKEVVVRADRGARIVSSTAPRESVSDELRAYPDDLLQSPPDVSSARVVYEPGTVAGAAPRLGAPAAEPRAAGGFESLIARDDLGAGVILLSLLAAAFWGAAHALTPGHGKAIVAGYLVGSRGKPRHAVALGLIVTATHTIGVFALGLVTLLLSRFVVPETLYPWLTLASGLLVVAVGATVLAGRVRRTHAHAHGPGDHHHDHDDQHHDHHHGHGHDRGYGRGGLLGVGVAAGILPCPSALVVLLSAIALHRVGLGLVLILAFSVGLAATVTAVGLVALLARRALAAVSALVILALGVGITVNALPEVL
jgi:nickel/cobalt transporter (NicO) family protein